MPKKGIEVLSESFKLAPSCYNLLKSSFKIELSNIASSIHWKSSALFYSIRTVKNVKETGQTLKPFPEKIFF